MIATPAQRLAGVAETPGSAPKRGVDAANESWGTRPQNAGPPAATGEPLAHTLAASTPQASPHTLGAHTRPDAAPARRAVTAERGGGGHIGPGAVPFGGEQIIPWRALRSAYDPRPIAITIPAFDLYDLPSFDLEFASRQWPHPEFA